MKFDYFDRSESLSHDPIHGYIRFSSPVESPRETASERSLIDSPWVQRLRQIHQLQTAWFVYPTAEHSRFTHVLGAMHLASRAWDRLAESFFRVVDSSAEGVPSRYYIESLLRIAALLHDVGHGPFGHFFDAHFLSRFKTPDGLVLTHESLGATIITGPLAEMIRGIRRNPNGRLQDDETLSPEEVAFLILRPQSQRVTTHPRWLRLLRSLFCGLYTVDNMDFVLRDAWMTGFSQKAFDLDRLLHYSFFSESGLTLHARGLSELTRFLSVRAELFRSVYFHRTVRAIDLQLAELFAASAHLIFPSGSESHPTESGDSTDRSEEPVQSPYDHLDEYRRFTEWSLRVDVAGWDRSENRQKQALAPAWKNFLARKTEWHLLAEKTILFQSGDRENGTIFSDEAIFLAAIRSKLPPNIQSEPLAVDLARHIHRPGSHLPTAGENHLYDPAIDRVTPLEAEELYRSLPACYRICRVYGRTREHASEVAAALEHLTARGRTLDETTNM